MIKRVDLRGQQNFTRSRVTCAQCRQPAVRRTVATRATTVLRLDGSIEHDTETVSTFWCARHGSLHG